MATRYGGREEEENLSNADDGDSDYDDDNDEEDFTFDSGFIGGSSSYDYGYRAAFAEEEDLSRFYEVGDSNVLQSMYSDALYF